MSNMKYCMFQNTLQDLKDCQEAMGEDEDLSPEEAKARRQLIKICEEIAEEWL